MKKKLLSMALIIAALAGFNANAQDSVKSTQDTEQCDKACQKDKMNKGDRKSHHHNDRKGQRPDMFRGITLTADQQSKLEALRPSRCEADGNKAKENKDGRKNYVKGERRHSRHHGMRAEYINKVKEILTQDQYVVFLENIVLRPAKDAPRHDRHNCSGKNLNHTECPEGGNCLDQPKK